MTCDLPAVFRLVGLGHILTGKIPRRLALRFSGGRRRRRTPGGVDAGQIAPVGRVCDHVGRRETPNTRDGRSDIGATPDGVQAIAFSVWPGETRILVAGFFGRLIHRHAKVIVSADGRAPPPQIRGQLRKILSACRSYRTLTSCSGFRSRAAPGDCAFPVAKVRFPLLKPTSHGVLSPAGLGNSRLDLCRPACKNGPGHSVMVSWFGDLLSRFRRGSAVDNSWLASLVEFRVVAKKKLGIA